MTPQQALANLDAMRKAWEARGEVHDVMREAIAVLGRMVMREGEQEKGRRVGGDAVEEREEPGGG